MARSARLTVLLLSAAAFLFGTAAAAVPPDTLFLTKEHSWDVVNDYYCPNDNPEVQYGCRGGSGQCFYPIHFANSSRCDAYVQCMVLDKKSRSKTRRFAAARIRSCREFNESAEFSPLTRKCEDKGAWGTCTYYENWKRPMEMGEPPNRANPEGSRKWGRPKKLAGRLATRDNDLAIRDGALPPWAFQRNPEQAAQQDFVDWFFCNNNNVEVANGCKGEGRCKYARGDDECRGFVECVMIESDLFKKAHAHFRYCPQRPNATEFSSVTRTCELRGSPGTCSGKNLEHNLVERAIHSEHRHNVSTKACGDLMLHPDGVDYRRGLKACSTAIGGDCTSYVECAPGLAGLGSVKRCSRKQMYNPRTRHCESANANGTCWQMQWINRNRELEM
jgi:hypothetical protein